MAASEERRANIFLTGAASLLDYVRPENFTATQLRPRLGFRSSHTQHRGEIAFWGRTRPGSAGALCSLFGLKRTQRTRGRERFR